MTMLSDGDLQALVEACLDTNLSFADTSKEVRRESGYPNILTTVQSTIYGLLLAEKANHPKARPMIDHWCAVTSRSAVPALK